MRLILLLMLIIGVVLLVVVPPSSSSAESRAQAPERWRGTVDLSGAGGTELEFFVEFTTGPSGTTATLSIPAQNANGLPLSEVVYDADQIEFTLVTRPVNGVFRAERDGDTASGTLSQGREFPMQMRRMAADEEAGPHRPQTPEPPFPYESIEVEYDNDFDGAHLAGTLTVPDGRGPWPVALLITGSGSQDRDETIFAHKPFLVIADYLSRNGIAVLRVDDRGVGGTARVA